MNTNDEIIERLKRVHDIRNQIAELYVQLAEIVGFADAAIFANEMNMTFEQAQQEQRAAVRIPVHTITQVIDFPRRP